MKKETCQICTGTPQQSTKFDHDLRVLHLDFGYALDEGTDRLEEVEAGYEITTCKDCRGTFIELLWMWAKGGFLGIDRQPDEERNIPVRVAGRAVFMTRQEWEKHRG